jgi:hypothetical protein
MQTTQHLTPGDHRFDDRIHRTHVGQAHWAEDTNKTCRECSLWGYADEPHKRRNRNRLGSGLKPRECLKFIELKGKTGPCVPHHAPACEFFESNPAAPDVFGKA